MTSCARRGNATDIPVTEHATDTHGVMLVNLGLFGSARAGWLVNHAGRT